MQLGEWRTLNLRRKKVSQMVYSSSIAVMQFEHGKGQVTEYPKMHIQWATGGNDSLICP